MSLFEINHIDPAVVSAITALVAVFVGPLVTLYVARHQLKASGVSSDRQQWINKLRDDLAALFKDIRHVTPAYASDSILRSEAISEHGQITGRVELINLLINPNENDHQELLYLIDKASDVVIMP